jgi:hypothetical protein
MLHRVALVRTDVSEVLRASIIRARRIGELGTTLAVTLYSDGHENLKSYIALTVLLAEMQLHKHGAPKRI